jgi:hypothetical protein
MREKGGRIVLMDFSTSRPLDRSAAADGAHFGGTPIYMAPELFEGGAQSPESDIYALGVLLFYLATGDYPIKGRNLEELRAAIRRDERRLLDDLRPDLPAGLSQVVHKAIARDPAARYRSAGELLLALSRVDAGSGRFMVEEIPRPATTRQDEDVSTLIRSVRFALGAAVGIAFLAFLGYLNEVHYNVVLHVPDGFTNYSPLAAVGTGLKSLSGVLVLGAVEGVLAALLFAVASIVVGKRDGRSRRLDQIVADWIRRFDHERIAAIYAVVAVLTVGAACFSHRPLFALFAELAEASETTAVDSSLLTTTWKDYRLSLDMALTQLILLLIAGWLCVFKVWKPAQPTSIASSMRAVSALVIFLGVVVLTGPWRLLHNSSAKTVRTDDGIRGCIAAQQGDQVHVWTPGPSGSLQRRVLPLDKSVRIVGAVANIFDCNR